jgi:hypothetical protein
MSSPRFALHASTPLMDRLADVRLNERFLALPRHLPRGRESLARPGVFHCRARDEGPARPMGKDLIDALCDVAQSAAATGDREIVGNTKLDIVRFLEEVASRVDRAFGPFAAPIAFPRAAIAAAEEESAALAKIAKAGTTRDPSDIRAAVDEVPAAIQALEQFGESASHQLSASA